MGVVYIGDRYAGKTHLAMELANPQHEYVKVSYPDYEQLKAILYDPRKGGTEATDAQKEVDPRQLEVQVLLPTGYKTIDTEWIDTTGEIWRNYWQKHNQNKWENFLDTIRQSEGILLIIEPYRDLINNNVDKNQFITRQQWRNRFNRWVQFFRKDCPKARRLAICLNKADLFCDLQQESHRLEYKPSGSQLNWHQRHTYVLKKYFQPIQKKLEEMNINNYGLSVNCFITSIYARKLLELPWLYFGTYLSN